MTVLKNILLLIFVIVTAVVILNILQILKSYFSPKKYFERKFMAHKNKPMIFGHRGDSVNFPENTIEALISALEKGADGLELDVRLSADQEILVYHDDTLERLTEGQGRVNNLLLSDLKELDAGYKFQKDKQFPFRGEGISIPTLREVLSELPEAPLIIELKEDKDILVTNLVETLKSFSAEDRVLLGGFNYNIVEQIRNKMPQVPTAATKKEALVFYVLSHLGIAGWLGWKFEALSLPTHYLGLPVLTPFFRAAARAAGLKLYIWTVNDFDEFQRLAKMGVHGILTDYPGGMAKRF